jgi:hypothetical protein
LAARRDLRRQEWGGVVLAELATVSFRTKAGVAENEPWMVAGNAELSNTLPWRTFRWFKGQRHYSGRYWSATMRDHVVYESRLELSRLIFDDFDQAVPGKHCLKGQPTFERCSPATVRDPPRRQ